MTAKRVLVAYASQAGSTAGIASAIAAELRNAGLTVDCRPASEVRDVTGYAAVVLGSGVFLARRGSDGGGFLSRHAEGLGNRWVWLFAAGPIGRGLTRASTADEGAVMDVARRIGARGAATFGALAPNIDGDPLDWLEPVDLTHVRGWARSIAEDLLQGRSAQLVHGSAVPAC